MSAGSFNYIAASDAVPKHVRPTYPEVSVQGADLRYFIVVEIKQVAFQVLGESPDVVAFGNNGNSALRCPPKEDLCWGCEGINTSGDHAYRRQTHFCRAFDRYFG